MWSASPFVALVAVLLSSTEAHSGCTITITSAGFASTGCAQDPHADNREANEAVQGHIEAVAGRLNTISSTNPNGVTVDRWTENGDGTATDKLTGLIWELKTGAVTSPTQCTSSVVCPDPHEVEKGYTWSDGDPWDFDGTGSTLFLA